MPFGDYMGQISQAVEQRNRQIYANYLGQRDSQLDLLKMLWENPGVARNPQARQQVMDWYLQTSTGNPWEKIGKVKPNDPKHQHFYNLGHIFGGLSGVFNPQPQYRLKPLDLAGANAPPEGELTTQGQGLMQTLAGTGNEGQGQQVEQPKGPGPGARTMNIPSMGVMGSFTTPEEEQTAQAELERGRAEREWPQDLAFRRKQLTEIGVDPNSPEARLYMLSGTAQRTPGALGQRKNVQLQYPNGQEVWLEQDTRTGRFSDASTGEEIMPPAGYKVMAVGGPAKAPQEPAALRTLQDAYRDWLDPKIPNNDPKKLAAKRIIDQSDATVAAKNTARQRATQAIKEEGYFSGMYGESKPPSSLPPQPQGAAPPIGAAPGAAAPGVAPPTVTPPPTAAPTTQLAPGVTPEGTRPTVTLGPGPQGQRGAQHPGIIGQRPAVASAPTPAPAPAPTPAAANLGAQPRPTTANAPPPAAAPPPGKIAILQALKDDDVQYWLQDILTRSAGITPQRGAGSKGPQIKADRGRRKFVAMTGIDAFQFSSMLMERVGLRDAIKRNVDALSAFDRLGMRLKNMATLLTQASAKMTPHSPAWNKLVYNIRNNITGDTATREYLLALTEFRKEYAQVISNQYMSVAATPIGAAEEINTKLADWIEQGSLPGMLALIDKARVMNTQAFVNEAQTLFGAASDPTSSLLTGQSGVAGTFQKSLDKSTAGAPGAEGNQLEWGDTSTKDPNRKRYTHDGGKTFSISTDGGKTWSAPRPM